jgi:protein SCO1
MRSAATMRGLASRSAACATAALLALATGCSPEPFAGSNVSGAAYGGRIELPDTQGRVRTLADFRGKAVVVFFGFMNCPDVCPTTLAEAAQALAALGKHGDKVQVLFVSVDPERDTPELLARYVSAFDARFLALRGDAEATARTAREFRVFSQKGAPDAAGAYAVDHSAGLYLIDPKGKLRVYLGPGKGAQALAHDLRLLLEGA